MFPDRGNFMMSGGQFISDIPYTLDPLQSLSEAVKDVGASHDSGGRYPPPQCHPGTRREVLEIINDWIHSHSSEDRIVWLYGPAGAGKSAIAQTIAETAQREGHLLSSFFFWRGDLKRNNPKSLVLTIAHGLAISIPELREPIEQAIKLNPTVLQASLEEQCQKLIVGPCMTLRRQSFDHSWLIVVDGLDECDGSREQQRILFIIANVTATLKRDIRLCFLICSRPEPPIREAFNTDVIRPFLRRVTLDDTFRPSRDIVIFLTTEFERIRTSPRYCHIQFPVPWPAPGVVNELAQKSSGQFIYAAAVVKFVDNGYANPCTQLDIILCPEPILGPDPESVSPFHDLDTLYRQILSLNPRRSKVREVIRALSALSIGPVRLSILRTPRCIEALLFLYEGDVTLTLREFHSILNIDGADDDIHILHASFLDFLHDESRSGYFSVGDKRAQYSFLACRFLHVIDHYSQVCDGNESLLTPAQCTILSEAWESWGALCLDGNLDVAVLAALRDVDFTTNLGLRIRKAIPDIATVVAKIRHLFSQAELLLLRLRVKPQECTDIIARFSNMRTVLSEILLQPDISDAELYQILDNIAGEQLPRRPSDRGVEEGHTNINQLIVGIDGLKFMESDSVLDWVDDILNDPDEYEAMRGSHQSLVQSLLDLFQVLSLRADLTPQLRSSMLKAMLRLSKKSGQCPSLLAIDDFETEGNGPVASGGFCDIWKGRIGTELVCLKIVRVYQVSDIKQIWKVRVKAPLCRSATNLVSRQQSMREAIIWRQLDHPNQLPFHGVYYQGQKICLISPWMKNGTLTKLLGASGSTVDHKTLIWDIASGLCHLHERRIVHADLKGDNILITPHGRACIADFGLSRLTDSRVLAMSSTAPTSACTLRWSAPEILSGTPHTYQSDVYAFACVCYEV
ncbi:hypothetical protein WG66_002148 [Moniliophthora roreri]|nr:hypothetical protein WG66_002148 [Moniliophthora roreri]